MQNVLAILKNWKSVAAGGGIAFILTSILAFGINWRNISTDRLDRAYDRLERQYDKQSIDLEQVKEDLDFANSALEVMHGARNDEPLITWIKDLGGRYVDVNQAFYDNLILPNGLDVNRVIGYNDHEIWPDTSIANKYRMHDVEVIRRRQMLKFSELAEINGQLVPFVSYKHPVWGTVQGHGKRPLIATAGVAHEDCR